MSVLSLERVRLGYAQGNRPVLWLLGVLFAVVLLARHIPPLALVGRLHDHVLTAGDVLLALPVLVGAATLLVAPGRRLLVAGGLSLAAASVVASVPRLVPLLPHELANPIGYPAIPLLVAGPLLIGHGLGGVRTRLGTSIVITGLVVSIAAAFYAFGRAVAVFETIGETAALLAVVTSVGYQLIYLGWAYLLAAAIERRAPLISLGAGLLLVTGAAFLVLDELLVRQAPGFVLPEAGVLYSLLLLGAWLALIFGVIREVDPLPDSEPPQSGEAAA